MAGVVGAKDVAMTNSDRWGNRGDAIAGSRYFRNFCAACDEPMRVYEDDRNSTEMECERCGGLHVLKDKGAVLTDRQRGAYGRMSSE